MSNCEKYTAIRVLSTQGTRRGQSTGVTIVEKTSRVAQVRCCTRTYVESFGGVVREADGYEYDYEGAQSEEDLGTGNDDWLFNIDETTNFEKYKARIDEAKANYTILQIVGFIHDLWYEDDIDEATEAALYDYVDPEEKYNNATEYDLEWESIINPLMRK